ncbi:MAG: hypothetical protein WC953_10530 [Pseudomonas sp.]
MGTFFTSLISQLLICAAGLIICLITQLQAQAADGDIIISREVQPRAAARQELVPDPNPQVANPDHSARVNRAVQGARLSELSVSDFAGVSSGSSLANGLHIFAQPVQPGSQAPGRGGVGVMGSAGNAAGRATGGVSRVGGSVNRSVSQGLRPLQNLQGK